MKLIPAGSLTSADPVVPIRWCLERSEAEALKAKSAVNIHVLFVIAYEGTDLEDRQLVPIDQMMTYLTFRRPGTHTVLAKVVWAADKHLRTLTKKFSVRGYDGNILGENRDGFRAAAIDYCTDWKARYLDSETDIEVAVPKEHFPSEPPAWLQRIANVGFDYPPADQCALRRRILLSPPKLFLMGLWAVVTTLIRACIALVLVLNGNYGIDFTAVVHPWRNDIDDVAARTDSRETWFQENRGGDPRSKWAALLYPYFWLFILIPIPGTIAYVLDITYAQALLLMFTWVSNAIVAAGAFLLHALAAYGKIILGIAAVLLVCFLVVLAFKRTAHVQNERELAVSVDAQKQRERERMESYDHLYKLLACRQGIAPTLASLPPERRTFRLKYLDLKARVCRPFAAN